MPAVGAEVSLELLDPRLHRDLAVTFDGDLVGGLTGACTGGSLPMQGHY